GLDPQVAVDVLHVPAGAPVAELEAVVQRGAPARVGVVGDVLVELVREVLELPLPRLQQAGADEARDRAGAEQVVAVVDLQVHADPARLGQVLVQRHPAGDRVGREVAALRVDVAAHRGAGDHGAELVADAAGRVDAAGGQGLRVDRADRVLEGDVPVVHRHAQPVDEVRLPYQAQGPAAGALFLQVRVAAAHARPAGTEGVDPAFRDAQRAAVGHAQGAVLGGIRAVGVGGLVV